MRLDTLLAVHFPEYSRGQCQRLIEQGMVVVGETVAGKPSQTLKAGENVKVTGTLVEEAPPKKEEGTLDILYEDSDLLVINKPVNLTVHPTPRRSSGTLVNVLLHHNQDIGKAIYDADSAVSRQRPGIVHRLDKDTSGVMVVAKTPAALTNLATQFHNHTVQKEYTALVFGLITEPQTIRVNIRRKSATKNMMGVSQDGDEGREAVTHIEPVESFEYGTTGDFLTLIKCRLETGRTHQIRVHCKYIGAPVVGDQVYSNKAARAVSDKLGATRQMLHASHLELEHPQTGEKMAFDAPLPADMEAVLTKLR